MRMVALSFTAPVVNVWAISGPFRTFPHDCPNRLARGSVESVIGKLRAIFVNHDRVGDWNSLLGVGNPAAIRDVNNYLPCITVEQLQARVTPSSNTTFTFWFKDLSRPHSRSFVYTVYRTPSCFIVLQEIKHFLRHFSFLAIAPLIRPMLRYRIFYVSQIVLGSYSITFGRKLCVRVMHTHFL